MCCLKTEGTQYGCGHYVTTRVIEKEDCGSRYCIHSVRHPPQKCPACPECKRFLGPDSQETITHRTPDYCQSCEYWFKQQNIHRQQ